MRVDHDLLDTIIKSLHNEEIRHVIEAAENEIIRRRGYENGKAAGTWVFDGNTQEEYFKRIQKGIEDGDPLYLDMLPSPRLGGEFADDPTWEDVLEDEGIRFGGKKGWDGRDNLLETYEQSFQQGVEDEVLSYGEAV